MIAQVMARHTYADTDENLMLVVMLPDRRLARCRLPELQALAAFGFEWLEVELHQLELDEG